MTNEEAREILQSIYDTPTIIWTNGANEAFEMAIKALEERQKGEWIYDGVYRDEDNPIDSDTYHCSICKRSITTTLANPIELYPFCHCGARMEAENDI